LREPSERWFMVVLYAVFVVYKKRPDESPPAIETGSWCQVRWMYQSKERT